jgi:hypothetical protein
MKSKKVFVKVGRPFTGRSAKPILKVKQETPDIPIEDQMKF